MAIGHCHTDGAPIAPENRFINALEGNSIGAKVYLIRVWQSHFRQWSVFIPELKLTTGRMKQKGEPGSGAALAVEKAARKVFGDSPFSAREIAEGIWEIKEVKSA
ncbi:MAG: hypothetical protein M0Z75_07565 [Nitrospiraceae bacterium]|nr:hypothetical protein [Nitrospiraceae bacterium]